MFPRQSCTYKQYFSLIKYTSSTPLEYSACGYSEEAALEKFGEHSIEVYHRKFWPLEWTIAGHDPQLCYMKCITIRDDPSGEEPVIGLHYVGPNAGEGRVF